MRPDYRLMQPRFKETIDNYVLHRWQPGDFIRAVLENDLTEAVARADEEALGNLPHIVSYVYNQIPAPCWGSPAKVAAWLSHPD